MTREEIFNELTLIFRTVFFDSGLTLTENMSSKDVDKWDSLAHLRMIKEVELHFNVSFKIKELATIQTVGNIIDVVQAKMAQSE